MLVKHSGCNSEGLGKPGLFVLRLPDRQQEKNRPLPIRPCEFSEWDFGFREMIFRDIPFHDIPVRLPDGQWAIEKMGQGKRRRRK
jgi:hypothetical protein